MYIGTAKYVNERWIVGKKREATQRANISTTHVYRFVKKKISYLSEDPTEAVYTTDKHVHIIYTNTHTHKSYGNARASGVHGRIVKRYTHIRTASFSNERYTAATSSRLIRHTLLAVVVILYVTSAECRRSYRYNLLYYT